MKLLLALLALDMLSCEEFAYPSEDFPALSVVTSESDFTAIALESRITHLERSVVIGYGHCWRENEIPTIEDNRTFYEGYPANGLFRDSLSHLPLNTLHIIRPYLLLSTPDTIFYGETAGIRTKGFTITTSNFVQGLDAGQPKIFGFVEGLDSSAVLDQHGHIWSTSPDISRRSDGQFSELGSFQGNGSFESTLSGLEPGTSYYVRAYAMVGDQLILGNRTSFQLGGWNKLQTNSTPPRGRGLPAGFAIGDKLYQGCGFRVNANAIDIASIIKSRNYSSLELFDDFWTYDLNTQNWEETKPLPGDPRVAATAFSIGKYGYVGWGVSYNDQDGYHVEDDFYRYDSGSQNWTMVSVPESIKGRYGATCFVVGDSVAYLGAGSGTRFGMTDFYKFSPAGNTWTRVADFEGRTQRGPASFAIGQNGYVVTGDVQAESDILFDGESTDQIWKYDSQQDDWTPLGAFPGGPAYFSTGFAIGEKGYVAFGYEKIENAYRHLWEFDPATGTWKRLSDFPADNIRVYPFSISTGDQAFIVGGVTQPSFILDPLEWKKDIWEYLVNH